VPGLTDFELKMGPRTGRVSVRETRVDDGSDEGLAVWCLDCPELYDRDGIYTADDDEPLRFRALCLAALELCRVSDWTPDVVHAHDWHAAWLPLDLGLAARHEERFAKTASVVTIHNIGYQGTCSASLLGDLGLTGYKSLLDGADLAAGRVNPLKTGVALADGVTTVSSTYATEILTAEQGMGLEDVLAKRRRGVVGIVNGIDENVWNPGTDPYLTVRYTADTLGRKAANTDVLLQRQGLAPKGDGPVFGVVSRLAWQKGLDLLAATIVDVLHRHDARLVVLGSGEQKLVDSFREVARRAPGRAALHEGYSEELAHLVEAGADAFAMPSRYEPCGLNQMYSQRYGTVPVVHRTGGLADTVELYDPQTGNGTGVLFEHFSEAGMAWALKTTVALHAEPEHWRRMMQNGMARDFSWPARAAEYEALYHDLLAG